MFPPARPIKPTSPGSPVTKLTPSGGGNTSPVKVDDEVNGLSNSEKANLPWTKSVGGVRPEVGGLLNG